MVETTAPISGEVGVCAIAFAQKNSSDDEDNSFHISELVIYMFAS